MSGGFNRKLTGIVWIKDPVDYSILSFPKLTPEEGYLQLSNKSVKNPRFRVYITKV